ncbi:alpha/beta hydrolase [Sphingopyxis sp. JAI128]|uniref:alpha/beta hydrolase n=1 Tax=Sphingopyxis sp. JAI128 TaxID=2723066 RepID=UPI0016142058|nr:alpha/beta hydrolase [Sphingopyxis sp. JAI128]MBB6427801.1 acetyl esterase/lipase [Sphingopyxis sp. JAI128]
MRALFALLLVAMAAPAAAADPAEPVQIDRDVVYRTVAGTPLHLDIYRHADTVAAPGPVLIHFHGGGWSRGARPADWTGFRPYLAAGLSLVTVQYRLADEARAPAAVQDARCALHWVSANAARLGFDPDRIIVTGTSAGGHLALMAGLLPAANDIDSAECRGAPAAAAILDFYGPADLAGIASPSGARHPTVANWVGEGAQAAATERAMSPVVWIARDSPPVFIAHGDADPVVPIAQSIELKRRLDALAVPSELFVVRGGGHGKFAPERRAEVSRQAIAFLCGRALLAVAACETKN